MEWLRSLLYRLDAQLALRVGASASLALISQGVLSQLIQRPDRLISGLWCVLTAIVVSQANLGGTLLAAKGRFLGVFVGCVLGSVFTSFFGANTLSLGFSVMCTVMICATLNLQDSFRIASLSVAVVMLLWGLQDSLSPWVFGFFRFLDSCLGILVAVIVSHLIFPSVATAQLRSHIADILSRIQQLYHAVIQLENKNLPGRDITEHEGSEIVTLLHESRRVWEESKLELYMQSSNVDNWSLLLHQCEHLLELVLSLEAVNNSTTTEIIDEGLQKQMRSLTEQTELAMKTLVKTLKEGTVTSVRDQLEIELNQLNEELVRFRTTRATREYDFSSVQNFFVLFYALRAIVEQLQALEATTISINLKDQR